MKGHYHIHTFSLIMVKLLQKVDAKRFGGFIQKLSLNFDCCVLTKPKKTEGKKRPVLITGKDIYATLSQY